MNAQELLDQARIAGVELWRDGAKLRYRGPPNVVADLLPTLKHHKRELLAALSAPTKPARTCADCAHVSRYGNCKRPVEAGLAARFELVAAPEAYTATCPAFARRSRERMADRG